MPAPQFVITGDESMLREFAAYMARRDAPSEPCRCHAGPDLFAPTQAAPDAYEEERLEAAIGEAADSFWAEMRELIAIARNANRCGETNSVEMMLDKLARHIDKPR